MAETPLPVPAEGTGAIRRPGGVGACRRRGVKEALSSEQAGVHAEAETANLRNYRMLSEMAKRWENRPSLSPEEDADHKRHAASIKRAAETLRDGAEEEGRLKREFETKW